ncbi:hypothetical protein EU546_04265, partial [Candidatus Thorarchaeota archaeon]
MKRFRLVVAFGILALFIQLAAQSCAPIVISHGSAAELGMPALKKPRTDGSEVFAPSHLSDGPLQFSTYLGGTNREGGRSIAADSEGNIFVTGFTDSEDFPVTKEGVTYNGGYFDAFVTKWSPNGSLIYSTLLGGSSSEWGDSITLDEKGLPLITGFTTSDDFPMVDAFDSTLSGGQDCFIVKLDENGDIIYSTYFGGSDDDRGYDIAPDGTGKVVVTGFTYSADFPMLHPFDNSHNGGADCFIFELDIRSNSLQYSTFLGGSEWDSGNSLAVSSDGHVYVAGFTRSSNFPTINAIDSTIEGYSDAFVFKLNPSGNSSDFSSYLGGESSERVWGITLDSAEDVYIVGRTDSYDFPTVLNETRGGSSDAFIVRLNATSNDITLSRFLGGLNQDQAYDVKVNEAGEVYVCGSTSSPNFPQVYSPYETDIDDSTAFVCQLNRTNFAIEFSVVLDGSVTANSVSCDDSGGFFVTGQSDS